MKNNLAKTEPSSEEAIVFIALGSNQSDPMAQVTTAIHTIAQHQEITLVKQSGLYASKPYGYLDQDDFINAVIKIATKLTPHALFELLQSIEIEQNRKKTFRWGPRTIDLDILAYGNASINTVNLIIPHPDLANRNFVVIPWHEIDPLWVLPNNIKITDLMIKLKAEDKVNGISLCLNSPSI